MWKDQRNSFINKTTEKLVKCLVGPELTASEERKLEHYATSRIRKTRLSTNSHQVRRNIDNMVERYRVEGMPNQAEALRYLTTFVIDHEVWKEHWKCEVDVQYSVIDFLLHMTHEPIQIVRRDRFRMDMRLRALRDKFKAATAPLPISRQNLKTPELMAELREGFIPQSSSSDDSDSSLSDWSGESSSHEEESKTELQVESTTSQRPSDIVIVYFNEKFHHSGSDAYPSPESFTYRTGQVLDIEIPESLSAISMKSSRSSWCTLRDLPQLRPPKQMSSISEFAFEPAKQLETVLLGWWRSDVFVRSETYDKNTMLNFATAYVQVRNRQMRGGTRLTIPKTIPESYLLREIFFMFFEPVSCCFFHVDSDNQISVRRHVTISRFSCPTMKCVLETEVVPAMQAMQELRQLIKELTLPIKHKPTTGTLEYFAVALRDLITPIVERLLDYEHVVGTVTPTTLLDFVRYMDEDFKQLLLLQQLTSNAVINAPPHLRSANLLSHLYGFTKIDAPQQRLAIALLLMTIKRYCTIIDNWWHCAEMNDCRDEYVVEYSSEDKAWAAGQSVRERYLPDNAPLADIRLRESLRCCTFYELLVQHALESGQTQNLLASLNLLGDLMAKSNQTGPLHSELIQQFFVDLKSFGSTAPPEGRRRWSFLDDVIEEQEQSDTQLLVHSVGDPLMMGLFTQHIRQEKLTQLKRERTMPLQVLDILDALDQCSPLQLPLMLPRVLAKVLHTRYEQANVYVMRWYREELLLSDHVRFLRHLFLLEADYLLYPFYTNLFIQIESSENWWHSTDLTKELYTILDPHYPGLAGDIEVELISQSRSQSIKVFVALEAIQLKYAMPYGLRCIITEDHMRRYNDIWRLLLKVKWAAWKLENMRFIRRAPKDLYAPLDLLGLTVRRLEMLRFWILYLVNSLHSNLCTYVIYTLGGQFVDELENICNMHELTRLHNEYLLLLSRHCLLTNDFKELRAAIDQIFHLVFVLDMEWHSCNTYLNDSHALSSDLSILTVDDLSCADSSDLDSSARKKALQYLALNQVGDIEATYIRCHNMLAKALSVLVYKYDQRFLSPLELALSSSMPC